MKINKLPSTWVEGVGVNAAGNQLDVLVVIAGPTPAKKGVIMFAAVEHEKLTAGGAAPTSAASAQDSGLSTQD